MLTFEFTGVDGKMTVNETLTSGMVGRKVSIILDSSFDGLSKFAVFHAGEVSRIVPLDGGEVVIPEDVLAQPFLRFHAGVYATDGNGTLVIPTVMADGPYIRYGADPSEDSAAENLPVWKKIQSQIGNLGDLKTEVKDNLVAAINYLAEISTEAYFTPAAAAVLITILRHALYDCNQSLNIDKLEDMLLGENNDSGSSGGDGGLNSGPGDSGETESGYSITYLLSDTYTSNTASSVEEGAAFSTTLTPPEGYEIGSVTVTMGGEDITATAYADGVVTIPSVTADVVITAESGQVSTGEIYTVTNQLTLVTTDNSMTTAANGEYYGAILTPDDGYKLVSVTVTMGGVDITSWAYANNCIDIISVTGDIVITAVAAEYTAQTETIEIVGSTGYPNVTTFEYTEGTGNLIYSVAKQGSIQGGTISLNYDSQVYNNFNLNFYVFDANGSPCQQTDSDSSFGETNNIKWEAPGSAAGFSIVSAPFTLKLDDGCTFIACMRKGDAATGTGTAGTPSNGDFRTWVLSGGITITVEG